MGSLTSKSLKKKQEPKSATGIKYSDKSKGQPELIPIYDEIKKLLMPYKKGNMKLRGGNDGNVGLINEMPVVIDGRKKDEIWFAYALIQKGYVFKYHTHTYTNHKGSIYYYCFDYGYLPLENNWFLVVRRKEG